MDEKKKIKESREQKQGKYTVPAVETAFKILQLLSRKKFKESTLTEISKALSLTPTSCFRILQQLKDLSIVRFDEFKKRYTLGPYLVVLGERAKESLDYIPICLPYLEKLTSSTGLTSVLVNLVEEDRLTHIAKVEGEDYGLKVSIGRHFSMFVGAYGECFLAFMDEEEREKLLEKSTLTKHERILFEGKLEEIKSNGFAVYIGEQQFAGIFGVAAPVFSLGNQLELCISILGLSAQFSKEEMYEKIGPFVKQTASLITNELTKSN